MGATLVEVLVAVLVVTIGLLGVAGTQVRALSAAQAAYHELQAALLADAVVESVRAHGGGALGASRLAHFRELAGERLPNGRLALRHPAPGGPGHVSVQWTGSAGAVNGDRRLQRTFYR